MEKIHKETLEEFNSHFNCKGFPFEFDENGYLIVEHGSVMGGKCYKTAMIKDIEDYVQTELKKMVKRIDIEIVASGFVEYKKSNILIDKIHKFYNNAF